MIRSWIACLCLLPVSAAPSVASSDDWPQWRGPTQNGVSTATNLPTTWSEDEHIVWKTDLPWWSGATPIVVDDAIFITSCEAVSAEELEEARKRAEQSRRRVRGGSRHPGGQVLRLLCVSREDGSIRWDKEVDEGNKLFRKGNNTSPSPVSDGDFVWVVTGNGQVIALDMEGNELWGVSLQEEYGTFGLNWGYASSPLLHDGQLIIQVLHGTHTDEPSYVVSFDAESGDVNWKVDRPTDAPAESPDAYTTPLLVPVADGGVQYVISGGDYVTGHDPKTGEELWRVAGLNPRKARNYRIVASPVYGAGLIFAPTRQRPLTAIALGDDGRPDAGDIAWQWNEQGGPDVPTPVCDGTYFYMVDDSGMATCLRAATGEVVWGPERTVQGTVSSSPVLADGKLYFTNEEGVTVVLKAGETFELLAENPLDGSYTLSSPVPSGEQLLLRTGKALYCIGHDAGS